MVFGYGAGVVGAEWVVAGAVLALLCCGWALYAGVRGRFQVWNWLLDEFEFVGDERVLDLGCGRGELLMLAAHRLPTGQAVGVDRGRGFGRGAATRARAVRQGVADRVGLCSADLRSLPFADRSFDLVVSSVALHQLRGRTARDTALAEAVRVLRPGGRLVIADVRATRQYRDRLSSVGMVAVTRRGLGWRMWWSGPWAATHAVGAAKAFR